jgi:hypothetical protein
MDSNQNILFLPNYVIFWKVVNGTKFEYKELWKRRFMYCVYVYVFVYTLHFSTGSLVRTWVECGRVYVFENSLFSVTFFCISQNKHKNWNFPRKSRFILPGNTADLQRTVSLSVFYNTTLIYFSLALPRFFDDSLHNVWAVTVIWNIYDIVISLVKYIYRGKLFWL